MSSQPASEVTNGAKLTEYTPPTHTRTYQDKETVSDDAANGKFSPPTAVQ